METVSLEMLFRKDFTPLSLVLTTYVPHIKHLENRFNFLAKYLQPVY